MQLYAGGRSVGEGRSKPRSPIVKSGGKPRLHAAENRTQTLLFAMFITYFKVCELMCKVGFNVFIYVCTYANVRL